MANCKYYSESLYLIASVCGTLFIIVMAKGMESWRISRLLAFVGCYSLSYFMLEGFIAFYLDSFFGVVRLGTGIKEALIYSIVYYIVLVPFAYLIGNLSFPAIILLYSALASEIIITPLV